MRLPVYTLLIVTLVYVSGCAAVDRMGQASGAQRLAVACTAWAGALDSLASLRATGRLSASQVARVEALRGPVTRLCALDAPATSAGIDRVQRAAAELTAIREANQ